MEVWLWGSARRCLRVIAALCAVAALSLCIAAPASAQRQPASRFEFTFTPKHGSWLNLVEGFWYRMS
jgi:hypothetical protein